jgi:hypothetical protein
MNRQSSPRQLNYSHALLVVGLVLSLLIVMFRPAGALADLPTSVYVYDSAGGEQDGGAVTIKLADVPGKFDNVDYSVILKNEKKAETVGLSGVPLINVLKKGDVNVEGVNFVKVRYGTDDDGLISLLPLHQSDTERPPMILSSGKKPDGLGPFASPAIVPGQPDITKPLREDQFVDADGVRLKFIPGAKNAKIMKVTIKTDKTSKGEYTFRATVSGGSGGNMEYQWYTYDAKGRPVKGSTINSMKTTDATTGSADHPVTVVVTERGTGSIGRSGVEYTSKKKSKGTLKNPDPEPTTSTGGNTGTGGGTGVGTGGAVDNGALGALPNVTPDATATDPGLTAPTPSTTTPPTDSTTVPSASGVDSTAITNVAQNVSGAGGLKTVSGVLLTAPTVAPAAASGGTAISALPEPVIDQINSIFQPVDDVSDAWAYLLALLFAFTFSGAVREWVKP